MAADPSIVAVISCQLASVDRAWAATHAPVMRNTPLFFAASALPFLLLAACTWGNECDHGGYGESCGDYGYDGYGSSGSSGYGSGGHGSSGYGEGDDASADAASATCVEGFTVTIPIPEGAGDCTMLLSRTASASEVAVYLFPAAANGAQTTCEALDAPTATRCARAHGLATLSVASASVTAAIRAQLGMGASDRSLEATLVCDHAAASTPRFVSIACVDPPVAQASDAGASDDDAAAPSSDDGGCAH